MSFYFVAALSFLEAIFVFCALPGKSSVPLETGVQGRGWRKAMSRLAKRLGMGFVVAKGNGDVSLGLVTSFAVSPQPFQPELLLLISFSRTDKSSICDCYRHHSTSRQSSEFEILFRFLLYCASSPPRCISFSSITTYAAHCRNSSRPKRQRSILVDKPTFSPRS